LQGFIRGPEKYLDSPIPEFYDLDRDFNETKNLAETKKLDPYRAVLEDLKKKNAFSGQTSGERKPDRETLERLKSLGYVTSPQAPGKKAFTPQDDLKVLLPYQSKLMQAMGAYHRGDMSEGIRLLEEIIAERKDFDLAYTYLATLYKEQRRFKEAVAVLKEGYQYCPKSYKVITTFGIFLTEVGEYDAALGILQEGLAIIDYDPEIWNYLGMAYWKKGDLEKALEAFEKCLELDTNYSIAFNNIGSVFLSRYLKRQEAESLKKAMENFKKAIELDPRYTSAYNGLGGVYLKAGRIDEAIACWEKTVELDPEYGQALYNLGLAYLTKGDRPKALEALKKYKDKYYHLLPAKEKENLDALIKRIQGSR
jgi:tetratricopeptide (TPR) repeat protein